MPSCGRGFSQHTTLFTYFLMEFLVHTCAFRPHSTHSQILYRVTTTCLLIYRDQTLFYTRVGEKIIGRNGA